MWRSHLHYLEHLRQVVGLRGYAQKDPLEEFKREAFKLFEELLIGKNVSSTNHKGIMRAEEEYLPLLKIEGLLGDLRKGVELRDQDALIKILTENISGFELKSGMNDLIYLSKLKDK